ncbi:hypothetical protein SAMN05444167_2422 [Terriglobus roseus]|uniref:Uncharacterized protein n=1 Tax=Terriglobus roseus TaxID=392734 RepID=A0A1G7L5I0_9BACT|nr:hypothetical protein SAMN05444167_2422 [Terriglobus roseus]
MLSRVLLFWIVFGGALMAHPQNVQSVQPKQVDNNIQRRLDAIDNKLAVDVPTSRRGFHRPRPSPRLAGLLEMSL